MDAIGLLVSLVTGWLAIRLLRPAGDRRPRWASYLYEAGLATAAAAMLGGTLFFLLRIPDLASRGSVITLDIALLTALAALAWRRRAVTSSQLAEAGTPPSWRWTKLAAGFLAVGFVIILAMQVSTMQASPYGEWDAFSIWNLRAKFLAGPGDTWKFAISPLLERTHPEYPPLLSAYVAKLWVWGGVNGTPLAPNAVSVVFFWAVFAVLASSVALLRGAALGVLACLVLAATGSYLRQSTWQYADIPLGLFFLGTLSLLAFASTEAKPRPAVLALAGALASAASLLKDEGLPFLIFALSVFLIVSIVREGKAPATAAGRWLALGALPGTLMLMGFKLLLAPGIGGVLRGQSASQVIEKLMEPERYGLIIGGSVERVIALGNGLSHPVLLLVILAGILRFTVDPRLKTALITAALTLGLMILAYWGVYLVTPDDLAWRIDTSLHRLYTQVWPSLLFCVALLLGAPADPQTVVEKPGKAEKKRRKRSKG